MDNMAAKRNGVSNQTRKRIQSNTPTDNTSTTPITTQECIDIQPALIASVNSPSKNTESRFSNAADPRTHYATSGRLIPKSIANRGKAKPMMAPPQMKTQLLRGPTAIGKRRVSGLPPPIAHFADEARKHDTMHEDETKRDLLTTKSIKNNNNQAVNHRQSIPPLAMTSQT